MDHELDVAEHSGVGSAEAWLRIGADREALALDDPPRGIRHHSSRRRLSPPLIAAACVLGAFIVEGCLTPLVSDHGTLMLFILAAMAAAWFGGPWAGAGAMVAGGIIGGWFFVRPYSAWKPASPAEWVYWLTYFSVASAAIALTEVVRRTAQRAERSNRLAESRGELLRRGLDELGVAESKLRELAAVVEGSGDAIISCGLDSQIRTWNAGAERLYGYRSSEVVGQPLDVIIPPDHQAEAREIQERVERGLEVPPFETVRLTRTGERVEVSLSVSPVCDCRGEAVALAMIARNISDAKRAEAALRESEARLKQITAATPDILFVYDVLEQRVVYSNREIRQILGYSPEQIGRLGPDLAAILLPPQDQEEARRLLATLAGLADEQVVESEFRARHADGSFRWLKSRCVIFARTPEGRPQHVLGLARDVTEKKRAEDALQAKYQELCGAQEKIIALNAELERRVRERTAELEAANHELEAFSYSVSHDLRAPLRTINGFSQAVLEEHRGELDERGVNYLQKVCQASQRMSALIEDLLKLSRLPCGKLHCQILDLSQLAESICAELRRNDPGRSVEVRIAPGLAAQGDEGLVRIALENLLGNAWKFTARTPQPRIEMGRVEQEGRRVFFVRDNGAGFDMAASDRLFGVFQRLHSAKEFPGTGIGLATVKRILARHGGEIWAEARPDQGAAFYFTLPENGNGPHS